MSDFDGEPNFSNDAQEAADSIETALEELTTIRAYVLSESEMSDFKDAQKGLRELYHGFQDYQEWPRHNTDVPKRVRQSNSKPDTAIRQSGTSAATNHVAK